MRSTDAGISRLGCGWRVAVITTTSSCATAQDGAMASSMAATLLPFLMGDRLHAMKHFLLAVVFLFQLTAWAQPDAALLAELRRGGYALYIRTASTDFIPTDTTITGYQGCPNQTQSDDQSPCEERHA